MPAGSRRHDAPARRHETGSSPEAGWLILLGILVVVLLAAATTVAAAAIAGARIGNPIVWLIGLATGRSRWPTPATWILAGFWTLIAAACAGAWWWWRSKIQPTLPRRTPVDARSASMARPSDVANLLEPGCVDDARRLGADEFGSGNPIGQMVRPSRLAQYPPLRASYEWVQTFIMGPRAGKTSCIVVRQICETSGPCVATSNKRDIVDLTRGFRQQLGHTWVFDPQGLIGETASWWWDPLSFVTDLSKADELAGLFADASKGSGDARDDAYFGPEGESFLSSLLYAAALSRSPITTVWDWLTDPDDPTPIQILRMHGRSVPARSIEAIVNLAEGQRDGVIGTSRKMMSWIRNEGIVPWITDPTGTRPQFRPDDFITTRQTLYLISREGSGTASAVTAALAVATMRAAEALAGRSPHGRLPMPLTVPLDEVANIVRWRSLPSLYSHFGSRGILLSSFFQSWSQGVAAFGREGMNTLWSASNIRVVGAGVAEADFLEAWAKIVGDHDVISRDSSLGPASRGDSILGSRRSVSTRLRRERIFEPAELAAMPTGRAIMVSSGAPPVLVKLTHWSETPYGDLIKASEDYYTATTANNREESPR